MKKLIAVLVAFAMVLSMSVMAFAAWEVDGKEIKSPSDITTSKDTWNNAVNASGLEVITDPNIVSVINNIREQKVYTKDDGSLFGTLMNWDEAWSTYYGIVLGNISTDNAIDGIGQIVSSVTDGHVGIGEAITNVGNAVAGGIGGDGETGDMSGIVDDILGKLPGIGGDEEPEVSAQDYADELAELLSAEDADYATIATKIGEDIGSGKITISQLPEIAEILAQKVAEEEIPTSETVTKVIDFIKGLGGEGEGSKFPDFGEITLPWEDENSPLGNFLDTILGILGTIGDLIFGVGSDPENPDNSDPADDPWGDPDDEFGGENNLGDVSFVAVAAVAAVAGVALVLTRKKENDAE